VPQIYQSIEIIQFTATKIMVLTVNL